MEITWRNCRSRLLSTATMIHRRIIRVDTCASQMHAAFLSTIQLQHRGYELRHGTGYEKIALPHKTRITKRIHKIFDFLTQATSYMT